MSAPSKRCSRCCQTKSVEEFNRDRTRSDGLNNVCRQCSREYDREYRGREAIAERDRASRRANRQTIAKRNRAYRAANLERERAYQRANPEVGWASGYRWRAQRYGFLPLVQPFTKSDVITRYGDACFHCGGPFEELDHYPLPVRDGGPHTLDNVRPSCLPCNRRGRTQTLDLVGVATR
ncbi:MAG: HNH endonuclease [Brooklawnia sp.]|jgi:hypothetical protein